MHATITTDVERFAAVAGPWLHQDRVGNHILLTAIAQTRARQTKSAGTASFGWVSGDGGEVVGAARWHQGFPATISDMPRDAARVLAGGFAGAGSALPGVNGPVGTVDAFTADWTELTGQAGSLVREQHLFRMDGVTDIPDVGGDIRPARPEETDLLVAWLAEVFSGAGLPNPAAVAKYHVMDQMAGGRLHVWDDDGPVAVAGHAAAVDGVVLLAGGFVPPDHRGHAYMRALCARMCDDLFRGGVQTCVAVFDDGNEAIVRTVEKIGLRPVRALREYRFGAGR